MSFSSPKPPDPIVTSDSQQTYNVAAGQAQNKNNSYNQSNPFGSVSYTADPNSPSGYSVNTSLSAPNQSLLSTQFANQGVAGQTAGKLLNNTSGMYSSAPNFTPLDTTGLTKQLNSWQQQYQQPLFDQQSSNLEAQLRSQGLTPGSEAYNNAKNLLARNQGDVTNQFMTNNLQTGLQAQNQNFGQQVENYQLPLQTEAALTGYASPTSPTFQQTPTAQIQPPNYAGQVQQNYQNQNQNYENTMSGLFGIGTGLAGGWAKGGFSGLSGMFGGGGGGITYGGPNGPTAFYGS